MDGIETFEILNVKSSSLLITIRNESDPYFSSIIQDTLLC